MRSRKNLAAALLDRAGLGRIGLERGTWRGVVTLVHHRIAADPLGSGALVSATVSSLESQLRALAQHCEVLVPSDLDDRSVTERGRRVMVTFDDCYRDSYELAFPILAAHGVRATFFLVSGFLDHTASPWWDEITWMVGSSKRDRLDPSEWWQEPLPLQGGGATSSAEFLTRLCWGHASGRHAEILEHLAAATGSGRRPVELLERDFITWEMAREMAASGMVFGGHTDTHPVLTSMSDDAQRTEIEKSLRRIGEELGRRPEAFAYPVGLSGTFDETTKRAASAAGIKHAFSNYGGYSRPSDWDPLDIRRARLGLVTSEATFRWMVSLPAVFALR